MPLELNDKQVLPDGIHDAGIEEIEELFGRFQRSTRRSQLAKYLHDYMMELQKAGIGESLIIDGSFVMGCIDKPEDIDIVLILPDNWDMGRKLQPFQYNLLSKKAIRRKFPFDVYVVQSGSVEESRWIEFFRQVNTKWYEEYGFDEKATKGLVRIEL